jgi:Ca-activated chloride channel family protein
MRFVSVLVGVFAVSACSSDAALDLAGPGSSGDFGATQGGVQNMSFARELVVQGKVPPAGAFLAEAMFSEHDLPLEGAPCAKTLCLRGAMGIAPNAAGESSAWVQVGMSSSIDPPTYERPSVAVIATVDVSGSMGWGYSNGASPGEIARKLLTGVASRLEADDRFAMVTYGSSVDVPVSLVNGNDPRIQTAINALGTAGSTNMEAGLKTAYTIGSNALGHADEVRILLFTDEQPNVGATTASEFSDMVAAGADKGVNLTVLGLGLGLGEELMTAMSGLRGGNAFSLMSHDEVAPFFEDNWPWFLGPIAYHLSVAARPTVPLVVAEGYGFPVQSGWSEASFDVASVFLSKRKGALLLRLANRESTPLDVAVTNLALSYQDRAGVLQEETLSVAYRGEALDEHGVFMPQQGIDKAVSLALLVSGMRAAAERYASNPSGAIADLQRTLDRFRADAARLNDAAIHAEAEFWPKLLELMQAGASQGSFYGAR